MSDPSSRSGSARRVLGYAAAWLVAAAAAVSIGVVAVDGLGASIRDRGPTVNDAVRDVQLAEQREGEARVDPDDERTASDITDEFGTFRVTCQGPVATGARPEPADGWRIVSYESGPDDDVDAVFARAAESIEIEVFCNRGVPTVNDLERKTLPEVED